MVDAALTPARISALLRLLAAGGALPFNRLNEWTGQSLVALGFAEYALVPGRMASAELRGEWRLTAAGQQRAEQLRDEALERAGGVRA